MRAKLSAGAEIDFLNKDELHDSLGQAMAPIYAWMNEMNRGVAAMRFSGVGVIATGGSFAIGDPSAPGDRIGPRTGYAWAVTRLTIAGLTNTDTVKLYLNGQSNSQLIHSWTAGTAALFGGKNLIITGEDAIVVAATGLADAVGTQVELLGAALEVPQNQLWKLY
jgi:hypothetical protein